MVLRFVRHHYLPELDAGEARAWFEGVELDETARDQVREIATNWAPSLPSDEALQAFITGGYDLFAKHFDAICETALEWWSIREEGGAARYDLWLYGADTGALYRGGTGDVLGIMIHCSIADHELAPEELRELEEARVAAVGEIREARAFPCLLASYRFA